MTNKQAMNWLGLEIEIWEAECKSIHPTKEALKMAIEALEKTSDKLCARCAYKNNCAIFDNFNINYCSDWRKAE